jgi:hypothetical protein
MVGQGGRRRRPPEETAYVLDPKAVYGTDFPGETFRVLKENELRKYGEYRTQRLILFYYQAWRDGAMSQFDRWLSPRADRPAPEPRRQRERATAAAEATRTGTGGDLGRHGMADQLGLAPGAGAGPATRRESNGPRVHNVSRGLGSPTDDHTGYPQTFQAAP